MQSFGCPEDDVLVSATEGMDFWDEEVAGAILAVESWVAAICN